MEIVEYYRNSCVVARMVDYMGGASPEDASCVFISECSNQHCRRNMPRPPKDLPHLLKSRSEISRSLWDDRSLLVHLDLEYVNFDFPAEPYINPLRSFLLQMPILDALDNLLTPFNIRPLKMISGRGFHVIWQIDIHSAVFHKIGSIGKTPRHLLQRYHGLEAKYGTGVSGELAAAYSGLGMIMEYLAVLIYEQGSDAAVPIELTAVKCGSGEKGREIVSIDLSEYGDPLDMRTVRIPFSVYLKHCREPYRLPDNFPGCNSIFMIPFHGISLEEAIRLMREPIQVMELAAETPHMRIPDHTAEMYHLVDLYTCSSLAEYHAYYYSVEPEEPEKWPDSYDRIRHDLLPPCIGYILENPNPYLMQPAAIRQVVRALMALEWHPRHIAGLLRSKYERDYGWGDEWIIYDAATRADFYTRLFSGLFYMGRDDLIDFNCVSTREKDLCFTPNTGCQLQALRTSLLERRNNENLGFRPFDRMFL